jgi:predicted SAM-dependent methyltransferase
VLEHLALDDFRIALLHTFKLLKHGGVFRMVVPDLRVIAEEYVNSNDPLAAHDFMRRTCLGVEARPRGALGLITAWLGNSSHLWMWDYNSLQYEFTNAGFVRIRQCAFGDSSDPLFKDVEESERFENAVAIECYSPMVDSGN